MVGLLEPQGRAESRPGSVVHAVAECLHAVRWNGSVRWGPLIHNLPEGLVGVLILDMAPSRLLLAWPSRSGSPLVASFVALAWTVRRRGRHPAR